MWHFIVTKWDTWTGVGVRNVSKSKKDTYKQLVRTVHTWLYSFSRPGYCEDDDEFQVSKLLLFDYLESPTVLEACENKGHIVKEIIRFVPANSSSASPDASPDCGPSIFVSFLIPA